MRCRSKVILLVQAVLLCTSLYAKEGQVFVPSLSGFSLDMPLFILDGIPQQFRYLVVRGRSLVFPYDDIVQRFKKPEDRIGEVVYDRSSDAFYGFMNGALVRFDGDKAIVVQDEVQGQDLDVHTKSGLYVVSEKDFSIVLYELSTGKRLRVLAKSQTMFRPRFSPDGTKIVVSQSRPDHGHFFVFSIDGQGKDMGQGYFPVWLSDSKRILFCMVKNDGFQVSDSDLYVMDVKTMERRRLTFTPTIHEVMPAVSEDDSFVVFTDAKTGWLFAAPLDGEGRR